MYLVETEGGMDTAFKILPYERYEIYLREHAKRYSNSIYSPNPRAMKSPKEIDVGSWSYYIGPFNSIPEAKQFMARMKLKLETQRYEYNLKRFQDENHQYVTQHKKGAEKTRKWLEKFYERWPEFAL